MTKQMLDQPARWAQGDPAGMLIRAAALPQQYFEGWKMGLGCPLPAGWKNSSQLLVLGMGGSAIGGDFLNGVVGQQIARSITVSRTYELPAWVGPTTLVIICSYSGNTEETLSTAQQAHKRRARICAVTSGGKLAAWCLPKRIPFVKIPSGWPPRSAMGYLAGVPLGLLARLGLISRTRLRVEAACMEVERFILGALAPSIPSRRNPAKRLAAQLAGRLPVLYGFADGWEVVAYRWRTQIEENAKSLAFHHIFPEATHNEISGWVQPHLLVKKMTAIFLADRSMHPRTRRRMEFAAKIVQGEGAKTQFVEVAGRSRLSRMLKLVSLGDFTSIYLALLYGQDPTPVVRVEALKKYLKG